MKPGLTLWPDEDFESEAAPPPPHVGDGGCGESEESGEVSD